MMFVTSCLLAVAILGSVKAQTFSMGNCDPNMETMHNFDKTKFAGNWYKIKRAFNQKDVGKKCHFSSFSVSENGGFLLKETLISQHQDSKMEKLTYTLMPQDIKTGKLTFSPGFIADEQLFWILDTDYDNYVDVYSCLDSYKGKLEYAWIMSRKPTLDSVLLTKAENVFKDRNIKLKLLTEVQDCE